jgi:hypothetical protein
MFSSSLRTGIKIVTGSLRSAAGAGRRIVKKLATANQSRATDAKKIKLVSTIYSI